MRSTEHAPALDGIRGLAILLVLVAHFSPQRALSPAETIGWALPRMGTAGVDLFFVLSGFLITGLLYDARGSDSYFRAFYARRALRIFPLYYGALALVFWVYPLLLPSHAGESARAQAAAPWYWLYAGNAAQAVHGSAATPFGLQPFWSLAVEEQFYLLWPPVVLSLSRRRLLGLCVAILALSPALRAVLVAVDGGRTLAPWSYVVLTPLRLDGLAAGAALALWMRGPGGAAVLRPHRRALHAAAFWGLIPFVLAALALQRFSPLAVAFVHTVPALYFAAVVARVLSSERSHLHLLARTAPMRLLGRYSYGLYVLHSLLMWWLEAFGVRERIGGTAALDLLYLAIGVAASLALAVPVYHVFEAPILRLKARFPYHSPPRPERVGALPSAAG